jgi:hypothetical protein
MVQQLLGNNRQFFLGSWIFPAGKPDGGSIERDKSRNPWKSTVFQASPGWQAMFHGGKKPGGKRQISEHFDPSFANFFLRFPASDAPGRGRHGAAPSSDLLAGLRVRKPQAAAVLIDPLPAQPEDLALPHAREQEQPGCCHRGAIIRSHLVQPDR